MHFTLVALSRPAAFLAVLALVVLASGCGNSSGIPLPEKSAPVANEQRPIALSDSAVCALDADCPTGLRCFQGLCAQTADASRPVELVQGLSIARLPERIERIKATQKTVRLSLTLSADVPAGGLGFILERSDEEGVVPVVQQREGTGRVVHFDVPVGKASPITPNPDVVSLTLRTQAGTARVTLVPELPADGVYLGEATLSTFGQLGLPIEMTIVTDPVGTSLEAASRAFLVLPVEEGNLFSATTPSALGPSFITRELQYDAFVRAWVATFELPYSLESSAAFSWVAGPGNAVSRSMRVELNVEEGKLTGEIADRWSGLFEARSAAGVLEPTDVVYRGALTLRRIQAPPPIGAVTPPIPYVRIPAGTLPLPALERCLGVSFVPQCSGISTAADFIAAGSSSQASCALAMVASALAGDTTASQIEAFLDDSIPDPGGQSFANYMVDCAQQKNGTCVPSPAVICARELTARALKTSDSGSQGTELELLRAYQSATREAFLGRQFAAFHSDAQTRLNWLQASNYPAIVTSAVKTHVKGLLSSWRTQVLDAHFGVLGGQFDAAGGAVLGQHLEDDDALSAQRLLLLESTQGWRGTADALALGGSRWDTLLTDPVERRSHAQLVYRRAMDLYLVAGVLAELNRQAGAGANNALFAGGFRPLLLVARKLTLPFDRLAFERQGEVVVATSLDPQSTNNTVLAERKAGALSVLDKADTAVSQVIAQANAELLTQAQLTGRITSEIGALQAELAELCGLPTGCTNPDDGACRVLVEAGKCGFLLGASGDVLDAFPGDVNVSEAGGALLKVRGALLAMQRADDAQVAHAAKAVLNSETTDAFAAQVRSWNADRLSLVGAVGGQVQQLKSSADATLAALGANLEAQSALRGASLESEQAYIGQWSQITADGVAEDMRAMAEASYYNATANGLRTTADAIDKKAKAVTEGLPKSVGLSSDVSAPARLAVWMAANFVTNGMKVAALAADQQAASLNREIARQKALRESRLVSLEQNQALLGSKTEAEVEELRNVAANITTAAELEQGIVREVIRLLELETQAALAFERDLVELRDRRNTLRAQLLETSNLVIQSQQAELTVDQATHSYFQVAQRAQLLSGRLAQLRLQLQNVNTIVGSPSVVFAWADRLARAEERLERAKGALMDWVVALEYFAVRPFFDQRIQILLARNTTQLELIAAELERLQNSCGGAVNQQSVELSIREDLLDLTGPQLDLQSGKILAPPERFRELLAAARIPVDKRIRYRQDQTVGDLLNRSGVWAATFSFDMEDFANLGAVCNAKVMTFGVQLVGEGLGNARPTVSVLYDGTSRLRSCQPDITQIVDTLGRDATPFAAVTDFQARGRSISPLAGINAFGAPGDDSKTLGGLPLVSQYTVLIDPKVGENAQVNWAALEDVKLRVAYSYQDLFPAGQCQ